MSPSVVLGVKIWISKSYSHFWKGIKYAEDAGKPKNVQELEDCSGNNKGLMNNYHKYKNMDHPENDSIKIQGHVNFWMGSFL